MASITVMKNFIIKKAQGTSDDKLKTIVKILKNYNKLDSDSKKKIQPAIEKLYSKYKEKDSSSKETKKVGSKVSKKKFKTQELKDVISKFKAKIGQKLWKEATSGTTIKQDAERPAKPKGKRYVSKKGYTTNQYGRYKNQVGTPYWETRANRFDVKQPAKTFPRLAKGGILTKEDAVQKAIDMGVDFEKDFHAQSFGNELSNLAKQTGYRKSPSASGSLGREFFYHLQKIYDKKRGKFAKGGMVEHGLKKGDKVVNSFYNGVFVENDGKTYVVNLNIGKRYSEDEFMEGKGQDIIKRARQ